MLLCACAYGVKSETSQVRKIKRSFSLFLLTSIVHNVCVCMVCTMCAWTSCLRTKIHCYCLWPFAKKLYHGWITTMTSSNEISIKIAPPKWRPGCAPGPNILTLSEQLYLVWATASRSTKLQGMLEILVCHGTLWPPWLRLYHEVTNYTLSHNTFLPSESVRQKAVKFELQVCNN